MPLPAEKSAQLPSGLVHSSGSDSKTPSPAVVQPTLKSLEKSPLTRRLVLQADDGEAEATVGDDDDGRTSIEDGRDVENGFCREVAGNDENPVGTADEEDCDDSTRDRVIVVVLVEKTVVVPESVSVVVRSANDEGDESDGTEESEESEESEKSEDSEESASLLAGPSLQRDAVVV